MASVKRAMGNPIPHKTYEVSRVIIACDWFGRTEATAAPFEAVTIGVAAGSSHTAVIAERFVLGCTYILSDPVSMCQRIRDMGLAH